jgi:AraC family transcriptional activator of pobA
MGRSSGVRVTGPEGRITRHRVDGTPVYAYERRPGSPPVSVLRLVGPRLPGDDHAHAHDFLVLLYFEHGGGGLEIAGRQWPAATGDAFLIAPGEVVGPRDPRGLEHAQAWAVFFPPETLRRHGGFLSWRSHPLLFPFVRPAAAGAQRLHVPADERAAWSQHFTALDRELRERRDGHGEAVQAHLTLLLVGVSRLAADVVGDLRLRDEPILADVFAFVEAHYREPISLRDVARAVGLSPGHLTTLVGQKTGRTVQQWINERRMAEARRLLVETSLTVEAVGAEVGFRDPSYFIKSFRRAHAVTPLQWRRTGGTPAG